MDIITVAEYSDLEVVELLKCVYDFDATQPVGAVDTLVLKICLRGVIGTFSSWDVFLLLRATESNFVASVVCSPYFEVMMACRELLEDLI